MAVGAAGRGPARIDDSGSSDSDETAFGEPEEGAPDRPAKLFQVSLEEAQRFVDVVGGVRRFNEMLGALSSDGKTIRLMEMQSWRDAAEWLGTAREEQEAPASQQAALASPARKEQEAPASPPREEQAALASPARKEQEAPASPPREEREAPAPASPAREEEAASGPPRSPAGGSAQAHRKARRLRDARASDGTEPAPCSEAPCSRAPPSTSTTAPPPPSAEGNDRPGPGSGEGGHAGYRQAADVEELHATMVKLFNDFEPEVEGSASDKFRSFSLTMLETPATKPAFAQWMLTSAAAEWMKEEIDIRPVRARMIQDFVRATIRADEENSTHSPTLRGVRLTHAADVWNLTQRCLNRKLALFDFTIPDMVGRQSAEISQVQAHVLVKAGKFHVSCKGSNGEPGRVRILRFRAKHVDGRHAVEARFLGSDEKYPMLQPWVVLGHSDGIDFFGVRGRVLKNLSRELVQVMPRLADEQALPGGLVFSLGFWREAPVIVIREVYRTGARMKCVGATTTEFLQDYTLHFEEQLPFQLEEYIDYLDGRG